MIEMKKEKHNQCVISAVSPLANTIVWRSDENMTETHKKIKYGRNTQKDKNMTETHKAKDTCKAMI